MSPPTPPNSFDGVSNCGTVDTGNTGVLPRGKGTFTHLHPTGFADHTILARPCRYVYLVLTVLVVLTLPSTQM